MPLPYLPLQTNKALTPYQNAHIFLPAPLRLRNLCLGSMCSLRIQLKKGGSGKNWLPLPEIKVGLMGSGGKPLPPDTIQKGLIATEGQESGMSTKFPCPGSGIQGLDRVDVYNTM